MLTDLFLQQGSGFGGAHSLATRAPHQRVCILTNYAGLGISKSALALGVEAVCEKSTKLGSLIDRLISGPGRVCDAAGEEHCRLSEPHADGSRFTAMPRRPLLSATWPRASFVLPECLLQEPICPTSREGRGVVLDHPPGKKSTGRELVEGMGVASAPRSRSIS